MKSVFQFCQLSHQYPLHSSILFPDARSCINLVMFIFSQSRTFPKHARSLSLSLLFLSFITTFLKNIEQFHLIAFSLKKIFLVKYNIHIEKSHRVQFQYAQTKHSCNQMLEKKLPSCCLLVTPSQQ